jgi:hypothetical protein
MLYRDFMVQKYNPTAPVRKGWYELKWIPVVSTGIAETWNDLNEVLEEENDEGLTHSEIFKSLSETNIKNWPPIIVHPAHHKNKYSTIDGFHRLSVAYQKGIPEIQAFIYREDVPLNSPSHKKSSLENPIWVLRSDGRRELVPFTPTGIVPFRRVSGKLEHIDPYKHWSHRTNMNRIADGKPLATRREFGQKIFNPLTYGNFKLSHTVAIFDLPAGDASLFGTCDRKCFKCYAISDAQKKNGRDIQVKRFRNLELTKQPWFIEAILSSLGKKGITACRVHSSGDFYSQAYINKWITIAKRAATLYPHIDFYAYTKRIGQKGFDLNELKRQPNFTVINSLGWTYKGKQALNYGSREQLKELVESHGFHLKGVLCPCGEQTRIVKDEYEKLSTKEKEASKICGTTCVRCQTKEAQKVPTVFLIHQAGHDAIAENEV